MYLSHYNLAKEPFQITSNPRFLWLGEKHQEALATLNYGVLNNKGFLLLTGDVGTGKTTLINALLKAVDSKTVVAIVVDPDLGKLEFFKFLGRVFGIGEDFSTKVDFLTRFTTFLNTAHSKGKTVLLIIDEAHRLSKELLEEIRLLSNIEKEDAKLLNVFFVGQNEFNDLLMEQDCRALRQRITITYQITPLTETETAEYVKYRLKVAGSEKEIFDSKSIREIYRCSRGYPRLINIICDHALLTGFVKGINAIPAAVIHECTKELTLPGEVRPSQSLSKPRLTYPASSFLLKSALSIGLVLTIAFCGYLLDPEGYNGVIGGVRDYYSQVFGSPQDSSSRSDDITAEVLQPPSPANQAVHKAEAHDTLLAQRDGDNLLEETLDDTKQVEPLQYAEETPETNPLTTNLEEPVQTVSEPDSDTMTKPPFLLSEDSSLIVPFNYDTNALSPKAYGDLDRLSVLMSQNLDIEIAVIGHTDSLGTHRYNAKLSEFRALIVKSYLVAKGISQERILTLGMAEENPREPNETPAGRAANRRVEIRLRTGETQSFR
jgi:general secretion pathway protein A